MSQHFNPGALYDFDRQKGSQGIIIAGVDEAGRGPLAGPVVAAAVCLDLENPIDGINDSKKLSPARREILYDLITSRALSWAVGIVSAEEIDRINILRATLKAMKLALDNLSSPWDRALIDGNQMVTSLDVGRQECVVKGDAKSASIAAASICAKVTRDRMMNDYDLSFPGYDFSVHKGYGTDRHRARIVENGLSPIHRKTFCRNCVAGDEIPDMIMCDSRM